ncbi:YXWGXW repeat-containing protein [Mucilaginibacter myungsuensis]|uniref:YXWGXW repeat-containing protein n=1 Tax=Mucilaginibacter myungsuensis TaxID=649104 RepID=A0A929L094_9SPHI|nr:YXWGXW repeat-containing protein [Mucilaginibacter myungsuensis]MBE9663850.1 YXWGXW repeat-containing protein [Mucilaginibacter myungsuensis]MDN3598435.1 YXWGXW repeat-containing protein [Mucilaginibacter myungsuensis]
MNTSKILITIALAGGLFTSCVRSYYVAKRPEQPQEEQPAKPYADAIWIPGDWQWKGHQYTYANGHWDHPKKDHVYVKGEWVKGGSGYYWREGHWR